MAVIAEGVPEADTKKLIAYAREHNKILLGPATVGGIQVSCLPSTLSSEAKCKVSDLKQFTEARRQGQLDDWH